MLERTPENVEIIDKKTLYKKFFGVDEYFLKYPRYDGTMSPVISREVMERGDAVGILLYDAVQDKIVLVEQFRVGVFTAGEDPWVLECAAGIVGKDETPEHVAVREAKEETGCDVSDLIPITKYFSSPGGISERLYVFCGRINAEHVPQHGGLESENEDIRVVTLDADEAVRMLQDGRINNAVTIISLQWFMLNKQMLQDKWGKVCKTA